MQQGLASERFGSSAELVSRLREDSKMVSCDICEETAFTNTCNECGGEFCRSHMLPENHRCESILAEKADPTWFQEGDAEVTLGEPSDEEPAGDADSGEGDSESTAGDQYTINSDDSDVHDSQQEIDNTENNSQQETDNAGSSNRDSNVGHPTGTATPPTPADPQQDTASASTVEAANQSRLSLPDSITRIGTRLYYLLSDLLRVGSILAVWIGVGLVGWLLLTNAALGMVVQAVGVVAGGFGGLYVTTQ